MKWVAGVLIFCASSVFCQMGQVTMPDTTDAAMAHLQQERQRLEADYALENEQCYQRFAVNNCLADVRLRRRDALANLRRQELATQAAERKQKGIDQLQRIQEKTTPESPQEAQGRLDRQARQQQALDRKTPPKASNHAVDGVKKAREVQDRLAEKNASRARQAQAGIQKKRDFEARQRAAQERKARRPTSAASGAKPAAPPLSTQP